MLLVICISWILVSAVTGVDDFSNDFGGFTFVWHDTHDLLQVSNDTACYYMQIPDYMEGLQLTDGFLRQRLELNLIKIIENDVGVHATTLDAMRAVHKDVLADYHCRGKGVFRISVEESGVLRG